MYSSSIAVWCLLGCALGIAGALAYSQLRPRATDLRLELAQHWARGGLLSSETEDRWRATCLSLSLAALGLSTLDELEAAIVELEKRAPQAKTIVYREALAELRLAKRLGRVANSHDWPSRALATAVEDQLRSNP